MDVSEMQQTAVAFRDNDQLLGDVIVLLYRSRSTDLSSVVLSNLGCHRFQELNISSNSKYRPAILNLPAEMQKSKVRRSLAVAILKSFSLLAPDVVDTLSKQTNCYEWDEINAGALASRMKSLDETQTSAIVNQFQSLGLLHDERFESFIVDTVYIDSDPATSDSNNTLAFLLGNQLEQLFDPLTEYSPEPTERSYKPPNVAQPTNNNTPLVEQICQELINVQTNFTSLMVNVLQNFIVPLRIVVLKGQIPGYTTQRLNQILPPTIDEVTRINCIFLDMLRLAQPFGSFEIIKSCGETIPYFYKALMRNQAATKSFRDNFQKLVSDLHACGRDDLLRSINKGKINDAVHSSLHLSKIRLIIHRLYKSNIWPQNQSSEIEKFVQMCDDTITSFAKDTLKPYNGRVFTPTGKILAEIANNWPIELQYGWLNRRVVSIFDATDLLLDGNVKNRSVIVVFSDHILFLSIDDDEYYKEYWQDYNQHKPSISDILMHSLVNETPFAKLPMLKVKNWSPINSVDVSFTDGVAKFYNESIGLFNIYSLDPTSANQNISEIIARSKVLNKSQSFHLFQNSTSGRNVYFVTQDLQSYILEDMKSPLLLLFNQEFSLDLFDTYSHCVSIFTINLKKLYTVKIKGVSLPMSSEPVDYEISLNDLESELSKLVETFKANINTLSNIKRVKYLALQNARVTYNILNSLKISQNHINDEKLKVIKRANMLQENTKKDYSPKKAINLDDHLGRSDTTKINKPNQVSPIKSNVMKFLSPKKSEQTVLKQEDKVITSDEYSDQTEGSIYVNSKFNFPIGEDTSEDKQNQYDYKHGLKYSKLKDHESPTKGYKDSVDLMSKLPKLKKDINLEARNELYGGGVTNLNNNVQRAEYLSDGKPPIRPLSLIERSNSYYLNFQEMRKKHEDLIKRDGICEISPNDNPKNVLSSLSIARKFSGIQLNDGDDNDPTDGENSNWVKLGSSSDLNEYTNPIKFKVPSKTIHKVREVKPHVEKNHVVTVVPDTIVVVQPPSPIISPEIITKLPVVETKEEKFSQPQGSPIKNIKLISSTIIRSVPSSPIKSPFHPSELDDEMPPLDEPLKEIDNFLNSTAQTNDGSSIYDSSIIADFGKFQSMKSTKNYENPYSTPKEQTPLGELSEQDANSLSEKKNVFISSGNYIDYSNYGSDHSQYILDSFQEPQEDIIGNLGSVLGDEVDTENTTEEKLLEDDGLDVKHGKATIPLSATTMELKSMLNDKSFDYLNAVFEGKHRSHLVRDPTYWDLNKRL